MVALENVYFKKNMALLKKYHPGLFEIISRGQEDLTKTKLVKAENNKPNLKVTLPENKFIFIHDREDPGRESDAFLSMVKEQSTGVVLMFGFGLGYSVIALLRKRKKLQKLVVFELNVEFFRLALNNMELSEILTDKRVIISLGIPDNLPDILSPVNRAFMLEDIHTLNLQPCFQVNPDYEEVSSLVFDYINAFNMEGATKTIHGKTFFENRLRHLTSMHHDRKLEDLKDMFKGVPAFLIAAGPSLDKNIDQIHRAVGKSVIIAVDTVLPSLLYHGIKPDFITSIDYQDMTYEKIANTVLNPDIRDINLICTSWVAQTVAKQFPANNIFWAFGNNALENWMNVCLGGGMAIMGAGTVAHLNFIAAQIMGCDPLVFVGQDLAFSDNKRHSSNVVLGAIEKMQRLLNNKKDIVWVKGISEPKLPTSRNMHNYRKMFEQMIQSSDTKVINATEGGAFIEGAEHIPLTLAIDKFCKKAVTVNKHFVQKIPDLRNFMNSALKKLAGLEKIINKAEKISAPVLRELKKLKSSRKRWHNFSMLPGKLQNKITTLDSCHNKADKNKLWELFDEMTMEGLRQNERQKQEIENLEGIPGKYLEWLLKTIERIDKVNKIRIDNLEMFKTQLNQLISYYSNEKDLLNRIEKESFDLNDILALARLYDESGDFVLLEKLLNRQGSDLGECAELYYYYGLIALNQGDHEKAEHNFKLSVDNDEIYFKKIEDKRSAAAEYYYQKGQSIVTGRLSGFDNQVARHMFLKGIKCFPDHADLNRQFGAMAQNDLKIIKRNIKTHGNRKLKDSKDTLKNWVDIIISEEKIKDCIKREFTADFFLFYGKILLDEKKYHDALENYNKALDILPDSPDLCIAATDTCFSLGDFDTGLQYLKRAVSLDNKYAVYWNNMGNNLEIQEDYNGAVMAYEQYYHSFPDNIEVLKKMQECYLKLGDNDAAKGVSQRLEKLKSLGIDGKQ